MKSVFSENLKAARLKAGLTQKSLAEKLNINLITYASYEQTSRQPKFEVLVKISDILGVPIDNLLRGDSEISLKLTGDKKFFYIELPAGTDIKQVERALPTVGSLLNSVVQANKRADERNLNALSVQVPNSADDVNSERNDAIE